MKMVSKSTRYLFVIGLIVITSFGNSLFFGDEENTELDRINGFNLVGPPEAFPIDSLEKIQSIGAKWIAIVPYAFCDSRTAEITYDHPHQWWGERPEGVKETIQMAKSLGLKIMIKPHLWVGGQGWAGDLDFESDSLWQVFEQQYADYIKLYAKIADEMDVELYCIGTEIRKSTSQRNDYWLQLISKTRNDFNGKLTYAANWDEYRNVQFWGELDYIGIDAYFPLSDQKSPTKAELIQAWQEPKKEMQNISARFEKDILFTEYGYESIEYNTMGHWKLSKDSLSTNLHNQKQAFEALFQSFYSESWWKGGFIWKWHLNRNGLHQRTIKAYTPQDKPALNAIKSAFKEEF
jgi:hypothetical protein